MNCPNCGNASLHQHEPAPGLLTLKCSACSGHWIQGASYQAWIKKNGTNLPETSPDTPNALRAIETNKARVCPECQTIMLRNEVGHGTNFAIDRCATCGGFWLDAGEFETLKKRNLHDDIHYVFSQAWQLQLNARKATEIYEKRMITALGKTDYAKVADFRKWLAAHPKRAAILAYLTYQQ